MTKPALVKLTALWQERLLLQDWGVTVEFDKEISYEGREVQGRVEWDAREMTARVLLRPAEPEVVESTLIHELLHLRLFKVRVTEEVELVINLLARAFMKAHHRKKRTRTL